MQRSDFWETGLYSKQYYEGECVTREMITHVENVLGYKLPASYIELLCERNGGIVHRRCCLTNQRTSWSDNHIQIHAILGIGQTPYSVFNTAFWIAEWGYPDIGIAICDCPSAGHDMVFLDYRTCGLDGEPQVVHVDQARNYQITILADNFSEFLDKLMTEAEMDSIEQ